MIFAYILTSADHYPEPCLVADKPSAYSRPIPVRLLRTTTSAVQLISNEEGITVDVDRSDNGIIIKIIKPCKLYLTPNLPEKPGFSVERIKVVQQGENQHKVFYAKEAIGGMGSERAWEVWDPNSKLH
jgi:hypothetical protein